MNKVPGDWKGANQCWVAEGKNDLGSHRLVKYLPMFQKGWECQSAFKHHDAYLLE